MATRNQKDIIFNLIKLSGDDPSPLRGSLIETPKYAPKMYKELLKGYKKDSKKIFKTFNSNNCKSFAAVMKKGFI